MQGQLREPCPAPWASQLPRPQGPLSLGGPPVGCCLLPPVPLLLCPRCWAGISSSGRSPTLFQGLAFTAAEPLLCWGEGLPSLRELRCLAKTQPGCEGGLQRSPYQEARSCLPLCGVPLQRPGQGQLCELWRVSAMKWKGGSLAKVVWETQR